MRIKRKMPARRFALLSCTHTGAAWILVGKAVATGEHRWRCLHTGEVSDAPSLVQFKKCTPQAAAPPGGCTKMCAWCFWHTGTPPEELRRDRAHFSMCSMLAANVEDARGVMRAAAEAGAHDQIRVLQTIMSLNRRAYHPRAGAEEAEAVAAVAAAVAATTRVKAAPPPLLQDPARAPRPAAPRPLPVLPARPVSHRCRRRRRRRRCREPRRLPCPCCRCCGTHPLAQGSLWKRLSPHLPGRPR